MMESKLDAWALYHSMFKDGDEVVVITEEDEFEWGRIQRVTENCLHLQRIGVELVSLCWDDIRFMAHDGFPVKKLMGADGSKLIEKLDTKDTQKAIRDAMTKGICCRCDKLFEQHDWIDAKSFICPKCTKEIGRERKYVFGDPFMVEKASGLLLNPGKIWTPNNWDYEEVLLLQAKDGARGMLWDLKTCYHFE